MPNIQENYSDSQLDIISDGQITTNDDGSPLFDATSTDYIRLTLLDENGNYNRQFYSNKPISTGDTNSQIQIYTGVGDGIFVKPNEILDRNLVPYAPSIILYLLDSTCSWSAPRVIL